jgi:pimeloyl-ACP methyl ester carboxylesterase
MALDHPERVERLIVLNIVPDARPVRAHERRSVAGLLAVVPARAAGTIPERLVAVDREHLLRFTPRTSRAPSAPIESPAPRMTACPTVANGSTCALSRAQRSPRRAHGGSEGAGRAAALGAGRARRGPREDPSFEVGVRRVLNWTICWVCPLARPPFVFDETSRKEDTQ